jgi:serine/threonine protein kinase/tetratricopeptide (TPR) repeat protein
MPDGEDKKQDAHPVETRGSIPSDPSEASFDSTLHMGPPVRSARVPMSSRELPPPERRSLKTEDLTQDRLLLSAKRVVVEGQPTPVLGGIPLLAKLGQGGMGAVYYGIHPRLQKEVAVKVLPLYLAIEDPALIDRFQREAQTSALVESPYLVRVLDVHEDSELNYIVMEFVNGVSAGKYLKQVTEQSLVGLPEAAAMEICFAATKGLEAAHARGVVHRDVKPDNILIPYAREASGTASPGQRLQLDFAGAKLSDLGLARQQELTQPITIANATMGSPGFMAPEQIDDAHQAGPSSDLFSLGATLYCLLAGSPPFRGGTAMQILMKTTTQPHTPLDAVRPDVSPVTIEIVNRCLAKKPENRYPNATELIADIVRSRSSLPPSSEMPLRSPRTHGMDPSAVLPPRPAKPRAKSRARFRWGLAAAVVASMIALAYVWSTAPSKDRLAGVEPACEDAWRIALSRVRAAGADLTEAEAVYAEFIAQFPLSEQAREAGKRRADLGKRIENARQALIGNMAPAYAAREKGRWSEVVEFLETPLQSIGDQEHPNREKANALLEEARSEMKRRNDFAAKVREGDELLRVEALEEALKTYQAAQAIWPNAGGHSVAAQGVRRTEQALAEREVRKETEAGCAALDARQWADALTRFEAALALHAESQDARAGRDEALFQTALDEGGRWAALQPKPDWAKAREEYAKALKLKPGDAQVAALCDSVEVHATIEAAEAAAGRREWRTVGPLLDRLQNDFAAKLIPVQRAAVAALLKRKEDQAATIAAKLAQALEAGRQSQFDRAGKLYTELKELSPQDASLYDEAWAGLQASQGFQTALAAADALRQNAEWARARDAYHKLLEERRQPAEAGVLHARLNEVEAGEFIQKGRQALDQGALAEARAALSSAEKVLPSRAQDLVVLLQMAQKRLSETQARADELDRKARASREGGDLDAAKAQYTELAGLDVSRQVACRQALGEIEVQLRAQAEKDERHRVIEDHLREGHAAMARGDAAAALKAARAVLDTDPTHAEAKLLSSQAEFAQSFGQNTMGNFDAQRAHIGSLMKEGRYSEAQVALKKCTEDRTRLRTLVENQPKNYLPEEVTALKSATLECQTMASTLAPFMALEPQVKTTRARLDQALEQIKPLPSGAAKARTEIVRARGAIDQALSDSAKAFAERNYFGAQNATGTLAEKLKGIADNALVRAAGLLEEAAGRDADHAAAYRTAAGGLRGR